ncbi:MAG: carboxy-S-adenosyl-L-methionine synthase CmoA [Sulfurovum sp.]|nr:carboxy-S-adenosyl-L-methionine synthase CmoA [Sulfurovum sp.]MCB4753570.1 carboxy-S-adenosyl-L-methionine synthase CmoA [Sulfurovum sp.]MCB4754870.1 carboxy-S-adenosyl-L-methionine synthase CmoA [Sulfurovum sp.]MCB4761582.1 carboxy-S-adenosyl-L-methionine synthase CmoA [Sulfurovum sp.]MCB4772825.1 carboxy-S-adenosyl-L-methionine synthase CmoA [Sulfurovum sp.]
MKDKVFTKPIEKKFEFDEAVASVFDDMLSRSVPFYDEVRKLIISLILAQEKEGMKVLDLGSSTAKFLLDLHSKMKVPMKLKGLDNSQAMLDRAEQKCQAFGADIELEFADMLAYHYDNEDIIVANYTLQFIRPIQRLELVKKLYDGLSKDGIFIFSEKVVFENKVLDKQIIDIYYAYKKEQGYSEYEIARKREALENVLIPFTLKENIQMCKEAGFSKIETIFQWANFVTFVVKK